LLEGYQPLPDEARAHAKMVVLAQESGDVLSRYHFRPGHFTASGFVVSEDGSMLLLIQHERLRKWLQPGGHIEPRDTNLEAAVRREIEEETGLSAVTRRGDGLFDIDVHEIPAARGEPHHEHHDLRYLFASSGTPSALEGSHETRWVSLDEVAAFTPDRSVLRAVEKLRS
jgi:8-oxo-dGTP pyrophosphatase MutT (NUDIX family)